MSNVVNIYGAVRGSKPIFIIDSSDTEVSGNLSVLQNLDVCGNITFNNTDLSTALAGLVVDLTGGQDASFTNVDISGSFILNKIDISGKLTQIGASLVNLESSISDVTFTGLYDLIPNTDNSFAIINQIANNFTETWWLKDYDGSYNDGPAHGKPNFPFVGGVLAPNGKVILVPHVSDNIGIYDPNIGLDGSYNDGPLHGEGFEAFAGGVLAPNGKVILVPFNSDDIGIYGGDYPLKNENDVLSPYFNKF